MDIDTKCKHVFRYTKVSKEIQLTSSMATLICLLCAQSILLIRQIVSFHFKSIKNIYIFKSNVST